MLIEAALSPLREGRSPLRHFFFAAFFFADFFFGAAVFLGADAFFFTAAFFVAMM
jgi:hypothetical protein